MNPILYPENETTFDNNGLGTLSDAADCTVIESLKNQSYELELKYPICGRRFADIHQRAIIMAKPNPYSDPQPFRIYRIAKSPTKGFITVYARHRAYDLDGITVTPFSAVGPSAALQGLKENAVTNCDFNFWTDISGTAIMTVDVPKVIWALLGSADGSVRNLYGGEYEFDNNTIRLWKQRGKDRGFSIRYGKNLTDLQQEENIANCYTAVHPFWKDSSDQIIQLPERIVTASGNYSHTKIMPLDLSREWKETPTEDQIRTFTRQYIVDNKIGIPTVSLKVQYVHFSKTEEYRGKGISEHVEIGDTVAVEFSQVGVSNTARVVETRYKPMLDRYESITLGEVQANVASTIANQQKELDDKPSKAQMRDYTEKTRQQIFNQLTNGGAIQGIYEKDGKWYINAEMIAVINLVANSIISGSLKAKDGATYFDLDDGVLVSVGELQQAIKLSQGCITLEDSTGAERILIAQNTTGDNVILFLNENGEICGGIGSGSHFRVFAEDFDEGYVVGMRTVWKEINGEKVLVALEEGTEA